MTHQRKFKFKCVASIRGTQCKEEFIVEIENSPNCEQEAVNALVRKLEQHFKDKHPKEDPWLIKVKIGERWAVLQADDSIKEKELKGEPQFEDAAGGNVLQSCLKCGRQLRQFVDGSWESHACSLSLRKKFLEEGNLNHIYLNDHEFEELKRSNAHLLIPNHKGFNWKHPGVIGGIITLVLAMVGLIYWFTRDKKVNNL